MPRVLLKPLIHIDQECIGIYCEIFSAINNTIRK